MVNVVGQGNFDKINNERNDRNKSCFVWFADEFKDIERVKLEIRSSVKPHPYSKKVFKSYIHEDLDSINAKSVIKGYCIQSVELNIERTFVEHYQKRQDTFMMLLNYINWII